MSTHDPSEAHPSTRKTTRRLRPEAHAVFAAHRRGADLEELYSRPVHELEPEELARMKAAFFAR